uniref:Uncharacterized protein n=1 Tax=Panagrellus redivivus TaxID=6233 RepID=A0A7E4V3H0_PANRE
MAHLEHAHKPRMDEAPPPLNMIGIVAVAGALGGLLVLLVAVLICVCRQSHNVSTDAEIEIVKPRRAFARSCPEALNIHADTPGENGKTNGNVPTITITTASFRVHHL